VQTPVLGSPLFGLSFPPILRSSHATPPFREVGNGQRDSFKTSFNLRLSPRCRPLSPRLSFSVAWLLLCRTPPQSRRTRAFLGIVSRRRPLIDLPSVFLMTLSFPRPPASPPSPEIFDSLAYRGPASGNFFVGWYPGESAPLASERGHAAPGPPSMVFLRQHAARKRLATGPPLGIRFHLPCLAWIATRRIGGFFSPPSPLAALPRPQAPLPIIKENALSACVSAAALRPLS